MEASPALPTSLSELAQISSLPFIASNTLAFMCLGYNILGRNLLENNQLEDRDRDGYEGEHVRKGIG
jgi:hypothetical protein